MKRMTAMVLLALAGCGESEPRIREIPVAVPVDISVPYDAATYPGTFAKWGEPVVTGEIQKLREDAARMVSMRPECDAVMHAEISDRSSPPSAPEVFVDCLNGNRWRIRGNDLVSRPPDELSVYG